MSFSEFQIRSIDSDSHRSEPREKRAAQKTRANLAMIFLRMCRATARLLGLHTGRWKTIALRTILLVITVCGAFIGFLWITLPNIDNPRSLIASQSTIITDRNGIELYRLFHEQDRTYIPTTDIPDHMKHAIVAIEDERFFDRGCIDMRAIVRALFANVFGGFKSQGASTITQQFARTALLSRQKKVTRKIRELMLACGLEQRFTKEALLELYLNWIPFGQNAYGIQQASRTYFGTDAKSLTLAESVVLAALPQRPTYFSPYGPHVHTQFTDNALSKIRSGTLSKTSKIRDDDIIIGLLGRTVALGSTTLAVGGRTDQVLRNMEEQGYITEAQRLHALQELGQMTFEPYREDIRAPHFVLWIRDQVENLLSSAAEEDILEQGGLTIVTTLDWRLQEIAENVVNTHSGDLLKVYEAHNLALLALHPQSKEILAYVGNTDFDDEAHGGKIDMVQSPRQPGSSFKPIVYAKVFENGYSPATVLYDVPTKIGEDEPQNFDGKFLGPLPIRYALAASRNVPAAKAFFLAGREDGIVKMATRLGISTPQQERYRLKAEQGEDFDYGWPLALGAAEVPLLEMVLGYSTFASEGQFGPPKSILKITDKNGNFLFEGKHDPLEQVLDPRIAYQITSILSDVQARPNEYWQGVLSIPGFQTAGKTGTSNKCLKRDEKSVCTERKPSDLWTLGYTPNLVAGVWIGNADSAPLVEKAESLSLAAPIWKDFLSRAHRSIENPVPSFPVPEGIAQPQISLLSGQLPTVCTPIHLRRPDIFLAENPPTLPDPACKTLLVDKVTGLLASESCPKDAEEERSFFMPRSLLPDRWPEWEEAVQTWSQEQMNIWNATPDHSGSLLPLPVAPKELCDISLTPGRLERPLLSILFPQNSGTVSYPSFQPRFSFTTGSSIHELTIRIDGKVIKKMTEGPFASIMLRVPRSIAKEGSHVLEISLTDNYFNTITEQVNFRFEEDRTPPSVSFLLPRGDITLQRGSKLAAHVDVHDNSGDVKYVEFFIDDLLITSRPSPPFEITYPLNLDPGSYSLRAVATDIAGNKGMASVKMTIE